MTIQDKIGALRNEMSNEGIDAFIVYSADPHMSEYLPEEWLEREWISGFTGSAGFVVFTKDKAALWTDSRYFVQAPTELKGSGIDLMKDGEEGTPHYIDWIIENIPAGGKVGVNALATAHNNWKSLQDKFAENDIQLVDQPLLKNIWKDRSEAAEVAPIFIHPTELAGKSVEDKLAEIREEMKKSKATQHIITALDDVAWTVNLRGADVDYNPVFLGYILVSNSDATLYVDENKIDDKVRQHLSDAKVSVKAYESFFDDLKSMKDETILVSSTSNQSIFDAIEKDNRVVEKPAPGNLMKAIKNEAELEGFRKVMVRDGVAMVNFLYWLKHEGCKQNLSEYEVGLKLREFRAKGENFVGESFGSIIGYQGNGAIVHYSASEEGSKTVKDEGSILLDSGGQYKEGTTDITRVLVLGDVTEEFKQNCTLVLQGMIDLSLVQFPKGTRGVQLDAIARMPLWLNSKDYGHGTGHGVGSFMNVHEGPQNIRKDMNDQPLIPGMVLSNEPGFYVENKYGIRHENLVAVKEVEKTDFGTFYNFETLTICPFFKDSIVPEMLTQPQKDWLNDYHAFCEEKLAPHLEGEVKEWFLEVVKPI